MIEHDAIEQAVFQVNVSKDNLFREFLKTLNPPIKDLSLLHRRGIRGVQQGNKFWIETHGSRASKVIDIGIRIKVGK